ncbi:hypothetical protein SAMN05444743_12749 [Pseudomonas sp. PDC86]|uniref:Uncharacterized protein n=1 Tax=Pseudomonas gorinensis TaxID=3240790 RepID=A0ACA7P5Y2_9PSED|nr:hypothetical protein U771_13510 [Pseudomonas sp. TKP]SDZ66199.1 hypothetical protein SAMN05444743_12749 [Pseudomonas sp. PDC86]
MPTKSGAIQFDIYEDKVCCIELLFNILDQFVSLQWECI